MSDPRAVALYTSDLRRTVQTATAVGERLQVSPVPMPGLREKSYGEEHASARFYTSSCRPDSPWLR